MIARMVLRLAALLTFPAVASAEWQQAKTRHFIIYADWDSPSLRDYAAKLERFDQAVRSARKMQDPQLSDAGRLTIYVFKDPATLAYFTETGTGTLGFYTSRASGAFAYVARYKPHGPGDYSSDILFFHEYAHHLMFQSSTDYYPPWLVEGFAELLATAIVDEDGTVTFGSAANHRSAGVFAPDHDFPISAMVGDADRRLNGWESELLYSRGWLLTHYLTFEPSRKGQIDRYVDGIRSGMTPLDSAKAAFGDLLQLDRDLDSYARRGSLTGTVVHIDPSKIGAIDIRQLSDAEAAILPVRMESDMGANKVTADRIAGKARRIAGRYPNVAFVQSSLAQAEHDARNYAAANTAADHALAADPNNVRALIYKGRALMQLAKANPAAANWNDIRGWFIRANHLDPENPEPLMLNFRTYEEGGSAPTSSAVQGLLYALVLAPQDDTLRLMAVRQLLAEGRLEEARKDFGPLASNPHADSFRSTAKAIVVAMHASDASTAIALIDAWNSKHPDDD
jgi:tetratricopeptide (TPR) repeat protein